MPQMLVSPTAAKFGEDTFDCCALCRQYLKAHALLEDVQTAYAGHGGA